MLIFTNTADKNIVYICI